MPKESVATFPEPNTHRTELLEGPSPLDASDGDSFVVRYRVDGVLGRGGMGEVLLAHDFTLARDVAMKRSLAAEGAAHAWRRDRLLTEARLQASVAHPAFVPVYDHGVDPEGRAYFTMAHVEGATFAELIRTASQEGEPRRTRAKLVRAIAQLCRAIECAHAKGIVHGDLKPTNVMLGANGEVYVLDLGIASPLASDEAGKPRRGGGGGTIGYAAPEQFDGAPPSRAWDVYALGALLFEVLSSTHVHPPATLETMRATYEASETSLRARFPDLEVAPELDAACVQALRLDPLARLSSAAALAEAIESFLDGARDHEQRRAIAERLVLHANEAHRAALCPAPGVDALASWRRSIALLTQALALVPGHEAATRALAGVMTEVPAELDAAGDRDTNVWARDHIGTGMRAATLSYGAWAIGPLVMLALGIREPRLATLIVACGVGTIAWCVASIRRSVVTDTQVIVAAVLSNITLLLTSRWFGALAITATAFIGNSVNFGLLPSRRLRRVLLGTTLLAMAAASALSWSSTYGTASVEGDRVVIDAGLTHFPRERTIVALSVLPILIAIFAHKVAASTVEGLLEVTRAEFRRLARLSALAPTHVGSDSTRTPSPNATAASSTRADPGAV